MCFILSIVYIVLCTRACTIRHLLCFSYKKTTFNDIIYKQRSKQSVIIHSTVNILILLIIIFFFDMIQYKPGVGINAWSPWKALPLVICVGIAAILIIIGLALGLGLGIGLHNNSGNLTSVLTTTTTAATTITTTTSTTTSTITTGGNGG